MREYEFDAEQQKLNKSAADKLSREVEAKRSQLEEWSSTAYGEVLLIPIINDRLIFSIEGVFAITFLNVADHCRARLDKS